MNTRTALIVAAAGLSLAAANHAVAANYSVNWLQMSPPAFGSPVPNGSVYNLAGIGNVTITYTTPSGVADSRLDQTADLGNGSVTYGADNYAWTPYESFARVVTAPVPPLNVAWDITYTFQSTVAAQDLVLGVSGLGRRDDINGGTPGAVSTATVNQNGTYLGEYFGGGPWGSNLFTPGAGVFTLENSVTGVGGANPHWNTALAVVRIDDALNSLTVHFIQTSGDGVGLNIGVIVPSPGAAALMGMGAFTTLGRRRR